MGLNGYPVIYVFHNGRHFEYEGKRRTDGMYVCICMCVQVYVRVGGGVSGQEGVPRHELLYQGEEVVCSYLV